MGKKYSAIEAAHQAFIERQLVWFVASCAPGARINLSPKGLDSLRVLGPNRVLWLNLVGSGNETAAHLREDPRMTLMFCSFDATPLILRLYGQARAIHRHEPGWEEGMAHFPHASGPRQLIEMQVELVHTSCGFGVPRMEPIGERPALGDWIAKKGPAGLHDYQLKNNRISLDGRPTGLPLAPQEPAA